MSKKLLSVVVPCYNEEESLGVFYSECEKILAQLDLDYEFIFINDGSNDRTLNNLCSLHSKNEKVHYISFSRNFGKEAAILAGLENSNGDYVIVMDADLQDPPNLIPEMLDKLIKTKSDCVACYRTTRKGEPPIRSFFAHCFYGLSNMLTSVKLVDGERDFRIMKRTVVESIIAMQEYNRFSKGIFSWVGFKTEYIDYENQERVGGSSKWSFWKLFKYSIEGILSFSTAPLALASIIGIITFMIAIILGIFIVIRKLAFGDDVQGWTSLVCFITFFGGLQLCTLGIIGSYIARIYMEVKNRPKYIIKETDEGIDRFDKRRDK